MNASLLAISIFFLGFSMIAKRLSSSLLTAPMMFLGFGFVLNWVLPVHEFELEPVIHIVAEVTLIILLFIDAAKIDFKRLCTDQVWPRRMLVIGLPLSMLIGTVTAGLFLNDWPVEAIALIAALLAPTDAALGQPVVSNPAVPTRVRRGLVVESGLNDGLALPAILMLASLVQVQVGAAQGETNWLMFGLLQVALGPIIGVLCGYAGGRLLIYSRELGLTADLHEGIGALALAATAFLLASEVGGNGFISAFVAGLTFGNVVKGTCRFVYEFTESEGQLLSWVAFFLIGFGLVPEVVDKLEWNYLGLILVSLFVVRPLSILISLSGTGASLVTKLFFGWFGPRGLATALFALLILPGIDQRYSDPILIIVINAVWISALLHGLTATPFARLYASISEKNAWFEESRVQKQAFEP